MAKPDEQIPLYKTPAQFHYTLRTWINFCYFFFSQGSLFLSGWRYPSAPAPEEIMHTWVTLMSHEHRNLQPLLCTLCFSSSRHVLCVPVFTEFFFFFMCMVCVLHRTDSASAFESTFLHQIQEEEKLWNWFFSSSSSSSRNFSFSWTRFHLKHLTANFLNHSISLCPGLRFDKVLFW